jgi:hypothetical protein
MSFAPSHQQAGGADIAVCNSTALRFSSEKFTGLQSAIFEAAGIFRANFN